MCKFIFFIRVNTTAHTHTQYSPPESLSTVWCIGFPAECSLIHHQGAVQTFQSAPMPALDLHSASGWVQRMKKRMSVKGELLFTQTCAGGCRGTGRRWRRTWGLVYDPWSSCRPPRSAGRSLPSLCRHRQRNTSQNMFQLQLNQNRIWHFEKSDFRDNETAYLHASTELV